MQIGFKTKNWRKPNNKWTWIYPDGNRFFPGYFDEWELDWKESFEEAFVSYKRFRKNHPLLGRVVII